MTVRTLAMTIVVFALAIPFPLPVSHAEATQAQAVVPADSVLDRLDPTLIAADARKELPPEAVAMLDEQTGKVHSCAFTPDGERLVTGKHDGTAGLWDLSGAAPRLVQALKAKGLDGPIHKLAISKDGKWLATVHGMPGHTLQVWELTREGGREFASQKLKRIDEVAFHPDSRTLVFGTNSENKLYRITDKGLELSPGEFRGASKQFFYCGDGHMFAAIYFTKERNGKLHNSEVMFWKITGREISEHLKIREDQSIQSVALSSDGKLLATASTEKKVSFWDLEANPPRVKSSFPMTRFAANIYFTPEGSHLIAFGADADQEIVLWNMTKGLVAKKWNFTPTFKGPILANTPRAGLCATALAPDGRHVTFSCQIPKLIILRLPIRLNAKGQ